MSGNGEFGADVLAAMKAAKAANQPLWLTGHRFPFRVLSIEEHPDDAVASWDAELEYVTPRRRTKH